LIGHGNEQSDVHIENAQHRALLQIPQTANETHICDEQANEPRADAECEEPKCQRNPDKEGAIPVRNEGQAGEHQESSGATPEIGFEAARARARGGNEGDYDQCGRDGGGTDKGGVLRATVPEQTHETIQKAPREKRY
jgi:hypothetical protein